jgi:hypothetical protein
MNITLHLILAHFLADFPFQTSRLAQYKQRHFLGVVVHSLTHLVTSMALILPFLHDQKVWVALAVVFIQHNILDQAKISSSQHFRKWNKFLLYLFGPPGRSSDMGR